MRLGVAQWSYQWFLAAPGNPYFSDRTDFTYGYQGIGQPYFLSSPVHVSQATPADPIEWFVNRCGELGVPVAHCMIDRWDDAAHLDRVKCLLQQHKLELIPATVADMVCVGDQAKRGQEACIATLERYHDFGGMRIVKFSTPMTYNRFSKQMPVDEQLSLIKENVRPIVEVAAQLGLILALENHYDYRAAEIRSIIEDVNSPHLRALLDVGSPFAVCEDPVHAAEVLAPYTMQVHLKDCLVQPWTPRSSGYYACQYAVPLGEGNIDLQAILAILRDKAPEPDRLCLAIENVPVPPQQDEDRWVAEGVAWARANLSEYLN